MRHDRRIVWIGFSLLAALLFGVTHTAAHPTADGREAEDGFSAILADIESAARAGHADEALARLDRMLRDLPRESRMVAWTYRLKDYDRTSHAWRVGETVCVADQSEKAVLVLDAGTGEEKARVRFERPSVFSPRTWIQPLADPCRMLVLESGRVRVVNVATGTVEKTVDYKFDKRIAPVPYNDGFVMVRSYRGRVLVMVDGNGKEIWERDLPGYVMTHPAVYGSIMVVQTRQGSGGGQATTGIDLDTGKQLWSETVHAYGRGAAFGDDAAFVVESDLMLAPGNTYGWLICRNPMTGDRLWEYKRPGGISHRPLVDWRSNRVFTVFDEGVVVCLNGKGGKRVWEARMPANAHDAPSASYEPYWPIMELRGDHVTVLDANDALHFFDIESGGRSLCIPAASVTSGNGRSPGYDAVGAMPGIEGGDLFVVGQRVIRALPTDFLLAGKVAPELRARALRTRLLLALDRIDEAAVEVGRMQTAYPGHSVALKAAAELCRVREGVDSEIVARLRLMRAENRETDDRLRRLTGLIRRLDCGPRPTPPLVVDGKVFVGASDGLLRCYDAKNLAPAGTLNMRAGIGRALADHYGTVVFPMNNRHVGGATRQLKRLFDRPAPNPTSLYLTVDTLLVRSSPYVGFAHVAVLDLETHAFETQKRVDCCVNRPVLHNGRLYYPQQGGGSASFDGQGVETYPPVANVSSYRVSRSGDTPIAYGAGGTYRVDEHMRPVERLTPSPTRTFAAARNNGVVAALSEQPKAAKPWLLEAWTDNGEKLPPRYATHRYSAQLDYVPEIRAFDDGFLLVGREVVYFDPRREDPVWRFQPGGTRDAEIPSIGGPAMHGNKVFFTHRSGDLYVFKRSQITASAN